MSMTRVNERVQNAQGEMEEHLLSQGSYDVAVDSGPAYSTQREMAAERLGELGRVLPEQMLPLVADLWVAQLDIPYAEELAARLKTVVPPEALDATKDKNPQTAIAALAEPTPAAHATGAAGRTSPPAEPADRAGGDAASQAPGATGGDDAGAHG